MALEVDLSKLSDQLADPRLPRQSEIAAALGVDQGFISHVRNRQVKRVTTRIVALAKYVSKALDPHVPVQRAVTGYLSRGGDPDLLVRQLELLETAQGIEPNSN